MIAPEHTLQTEAFDREYSLADLLDRHRLAVIFHQVEADGYLQLAVTHPDGKVYFPEGTERLPSSDEEAPQGAVLPLRHELENVGFLHISWATTSAPEALNSVAAFARTVLEGLMMERYRYLMSARLHGEVVEDSYLRLKQKADALAKSEARYKALATRLEQEVARQAEEIRATQARLMERVQLASIGQLAAGMAHEINNPMGFISSNLNTLNQYGNELTALLKEARHFWQRLGKDEQTHAHPSAVYNRQAATLEETACRIDLDYIMEDMPVLIQESSEGGERIRNIVANLKAFAQPGVETVGALDLNRCLEATLQVLAPRLAGKATPVCRFAPLPLIRGCESQLNQVFMNVILNAILASPEGGEIRLDTAATDDGVVVTIADDGPGIPPELRNRIFEPFYTTREIGQGCGLGLTLAYNTIQKHGGTIQVSGAEGNGTVVKIRLPIDGRG